MKKIQSVISNMTVLILLLMLGLGLVLLLSSCSQDSDSSSQPTPQALVSKSLPARLTPVAVKPVSTPRQVVESSPEPIGPEDIPAPTWTPVIILPEGTSPPYPTPWPMPTPTPVNPNESIIAALDVPVGGLAISPDDRTLAMAAALQFVPEQGGRVINQIWTLDLVSKKVEKLDAYGLAPVWSPDGQWILFQVRQDDLFEIEVIRKDGTDKKTLTSIARSDLLGYYWASSEQVGVIRPDGIDQVDLTGEVKGRVNLALPATTRSGNKPQVAEHPSGFVVVADGQKLLVFKYNGQTITIADMEGGRRQIARFFSIASDGKQLAYVVDDGETNSELWVTDLAGSNPVQLYRVKRGRIISLIWAPDNQAVVIGWRGTGTSLGFEQTLVLVEVKGIQPKPLGVDGVDREFVFSRNGEKLFYGRTYYADPRDEGETTLYQLKVQR
jgi:hypothetical protein